MNLTKKIWYDENSEPPKNYLWAKGGKLFKNIEGQWKEVSKKESEDEESGSGSMSMYDAWMKAFGDFKVVQNDDDSILTIKPALAVINASFDITEHNVDTPIPLTFMNSQANSYFTFNSDNIIVYNIKDVPDDIYDKGYMGLGAGVRFLYDLDELNEKVQNIDGAVDSIIIDQQGYDSKVVTLLRGLAIYVPYSGVYKINDKYYVWFPYSMD